MPSPDTRVGIPTGVNDNGSLSSPSLNGAYNGVEHHYSSEINRLLDQMSRRGWEIFGNNILAVSLVDRPTDLHFDAGKVKARLISDNNGEAVVIEREIGPEASISNVSVAFGRIDALDIKGIKNETFYTFGATGEYIEANHPYGGKLCIFMINSKAPVIRLASDESGKYLVDSFEGEIARLRGELSRKHLNSSILDTILTKHDARVLYKTGINTIFDAARKYPALEQLVKPYMNDLKKMRKYIDPWEDIGNTTLRELVLKSI